MTTTMEKAARVSAILTLIALALMVWAVLDPTPLPLILSMSLGQLVGTVALGIFGIAIILDIRRDARMRRRRGESLPPPLGKPGPLPKPLHVAKADPAPVAPALVVVEPVEPAAVEPAAVEPAAVEPAAVEPAAVEPARAPAPDKEQLK